MPDYVAQARAARLKVLEMTYKAQSSHIGSQFSVIDIMTVLFAHADLSKDQIILSAGWKAASFYYFLAEKGYFPKEDLETYCQEGSKYIGLTEPGIEGVLFAGGSMQMGVPAAVGFALAKKLKKEAGTVYCIMSDGELAGGMIWESALIAAHHELDNLVLIVDHNQLQAMGNTNMILSTYPLGEKWEAFQWDVLAVNGHDYISIESAFKTEQYGKPCIILASTVKGKGWGRAQDNNLYHYKNLSKQEYDEARKELLHG